ncbi:MAG: SBBP repeat-containing protein [Armatimonadota bacterium]|nr:SBBP repeat-containing protein [Armatimonadota bacterium]
MPVSAITTFIPASTPGIDWVYHGDRQHLEYDFVVAPGADPRVIRLGLHGARQAQINDRGDLVLHTAAGQIIQRAPRIYQPAGATRRHVAGHYVLGKRQSNGIYEVGFDVPAYDRKRPLIIDPEVVYSTYLGGSSDDVGYGIAVDDSGAAYVTGSTDSMDFPTTRALLASAGIQPSSGGGWDAFVAKLNAAGSLIYATYLGGSGDDEASGIAVSHSGSAYITGYIWSLTPGSPNNFPTTPGAVQRSGVDEAFVARLAPSGDRLLYSSYLGGSAEDYGVGIAVDNSGHAYVAGFTHSDDSPLSPPTNRHLVPATGNSRMLS